MLCFGGLIDKTNKDALKAKWKKLFKGSPPTYASEYFLRGHVQWQQQANNTAGLSRRAKSQLKQLTGQLRSGVDLTPEPELIIKPGTKLVRQYQGARYEVTVTEGGYHYKGQQYGSLSKIAREITSTRWNGKLFFGVKNEPTQLQTLRHLYAKIDGGRIGARIQFPPCTTRGM